MVNPGSLLVVGLPGPELDGACRRILRHVQPGGVILFGRNVVSAPQVRSLTSDLHRELPEALLFVDAEGGRVDRFREIVGAAPAGSVLASAPPRRAARAGRWVGHSLRALGCDVDFAPVVDLDLGQRDNALQDRYLGRRPRSVTARARAFLRGLGAAGVAGCPKHFPGLGAAGEDTHDEPARITLSAREMERHLAPFVGLLPEADSVMLAHASYPALDPSGRPATLSEAIATGLLRRRLGFVGLAVCDDLEMQALAPWGGLEDRALAALAAGCDALPLCRQLEAAVPVVEKLRAEASPRRLSEAAGRWRSLREHVGRRRPVHFRLEVVRRRLAALAVP